MSERKPRRTFTKEFKNQMIQLYASLKKYSDNGIKIKKKSANATHSSTDVSVDFF